MAAVKVPKAPAKAQNFLTMEQYKHLLKTIDAHATIIESDAELSKMLEEAFGLDIERNKHASMKKGEVPWMIDVITVACGPGLRSGEVRSMRWDWIDLSEGTITIQTTEDFTPKNGAIERSI